jgi:prepilin-type N-terminal cleavage/methylation domain-containing protein
MSLKHKYGFSLVELLVVIAIIAIALSFGSYVMSVYRNAVSMKLRDDVLAMLEKARFLSITSVPHGVKFTSDKFIMLVGLKDGICSSDSAIHCYSDGDCENGSCIPGDYMKTPDENDESYLFPLEGQSSIIPSGYSVCCPSSCSDYIIWFDRKGVPRDYRWGLGPTTITIKYSNSEVAKIVISPAGRIQYERK